MKNSKLFSSQKDANYLKFIRKRKHKMKKILKRTMFLTVLLFLFSDVARCQTDTIIRVFGNNNALNISFQLPSFEIKDTSFMDLYGVSEIFSYIRIDDEFGIIDSVGLPQLPQLTFDLHVPYNATNFEIEIISIETTKIKINRKIMPTQEDVEKSNPVFNFSKNNRYYNSSGGFFNFHVQINESFIVFGEQGINLTIVPFRYNPAQDSLTVLNNVVFAVSYTSYNRGITEEYHSEVKDNYLSNLFRNYQKNYNHQKSGGYPIIGRYLMITPPEYESTLTYFANYKRNIGFVVDVANTNTIGTTATSIKNYIQNRYNNTSTRPDYVLLVGDVDKIPAYEGDASYDPDNNKPDKNNPITDLGYSLLEGSDNLADVFLGRFSVSDWNGNNELKNIINKTIFMEMNIHRFAKKAKFLAGDDDRAFMRNAFKKGHEYVIDYSFMPLGYNCQKLYQPTQPEAVNALSDNPLFYIYSGHGSPTSFNQLTSSTLVQPATNTIFPCVFSFACLTGHFAQTTCIAESFIRAKDKGGIAYFGSSVNTFNNPDEILEKKIFGDAFLKDEQNLSVIINLGKRRFSYTSVTNERKKRYIKAYNLLGDPSFDTKGIGCKQSFVFNYLEVFKDGAEITYRAENYIQNNNNFVVENGAKVKLLAGDSVTLKPGFEAKAGSIVQIRIVPCDDGAMRSMVTSNDYEENQEETIDVRNLKENIQQDDEIIYPAMFSVFPNPVTDDFSLAYTLENNSFVQIDLFNVSGVHIKNFLQIPEQEAGIYYNNFSLSGLPSGMYILVFKNASKTISNKIIKY